MINILYTTIKELIKIINSLTKNNMNLSDEDKSKLNDICDLISRINEKIKNPTSIFGTKKANAPTTIPKITAHKIDFVILYKVFN